MSSPPESTPAPVPAPGTRPRRATSADVAREAGLSRATVGYVLNDVPHQKIPEVTRQRVRDAAARLGYTPSAAARSLRSGRSDIVLCLMPDWPVGPSVLALLDALSVRLEGHGYTFVTHHRSAASRSLAETWKAITPAVVLVLDDLPAADTAALAAAGVRVVNANDPTGELGAGGLGAGGVRIGRRQAEHLWERGRTRLGYAYPDDPRVGTFARPRLQGVRDVCRERGLAEPVVVEVPTEPEAADRALARWRAAGVDGLCAYNDELAVAVLGSAARTGLAVPAELGVVGVDDTVLSRLVQPALTTVAVRFDRAAARVAAVLAGGAIGPLEADRRSLPSGPEDELRLLVRRSS
ncbi:MAG: putative LacI family transcriptional regulator [Friedmanniella sp.]|nr:putative LacI family transcriptional regulator [Friedmanniella sp.]